MEVQVQAKRGVEGQIAGTKLAARFDPAHQGDPPNWDSHRWNRYRTLLALLEDLLSHVDATFLFPPQPGSRTYRQLIAHSEADLPKTGHPWKSAAQCSAAQQAIDDMLTAIRRSKTLLRDSKTLGEGAPRPRPHLKVTPPI